MSGLYFDPLSPGRLRHLHAEARGWADRLKAHAAEVEPFLRDVLGEAETKGRELAADADSQLRAFEGLELDLNAARLSAGKLASEAAAAAQQVEALKDPRTPEPSSKNILAARDAAYLAAIHAERGKRALEAVEQARATGIREGALVSYLKGLDKGRLRALNIAAKPGDKWEASGDPLALAGFLVSRGEAREWALTDALKVWRHDAQERAREILVSDTEPTLKDRQALGGIDAQWHHLGFGARRLEAYARESFAALVRGRGDAEVKKLIERLETPTPTLGAEQEARS